MVLECEFYRIDVLTGLAIMCSLLVCEQRANVPASIASATNSLDISTWGPPSAAYPAATCNIPQFFGAQQLVIDITLCGDW